MLGKPVVKGTRITVELILKKRLQVGIPFDEIIEMYPHINKDDILACVNSQ